MQKYIYHFVNGFQQICKDKIGHTLDEVIEHKDWKVIFQFKYMAVLQSNYDSNVYVGVTWKECE